jgi:NAD(P)-dependent dehydrogenase (short-subunit alcohol dehydrogenase family)
MNSASYDALLAPGTEQYGCRAGIESRGYVMATLEGRRILVIGASSGIGRAFSIEAVKQGAQVALSARRKEKLDEVVAEAGGGHAVPGDISDAADCERLVDDAAAALGGPIDLVLISAGSAPMRMFKDTSPEDWKHVLDLNVVGVHQVIRAALPHLAPAAIVAALSSEGVSQPRTALGAYVVSKVALERSLGAWRTEHPDVRFSCVAVGATVPTGFGDAFDMELLAFALEDWAKRGLAQAEFMVTDEVAAFLADMYGMALRFPGIGVEHIVLRSPSAVSEEHQTTELTSNL